MRVHLGACATEPDVDPQHIAEAWHSRHTTRYIRAERFLATAERAPLRSTTL